LNSFHSHPNSQEAEDSEHLHQCERCGHKFKHRIRLQLHWCAGLDPDEANAERGAQEEAQRRELRSQVEAKQRQEQERKQLWSNLLQVKSYTIHAQLAWVRYLTLR